jgi:hypothetical protein
MKKLITSAVLCAAMATAVSTFGVQPVSATYPLIDKNGNTVPVERDVDNQKIIDDNQKLMDRYLWYDQVGDNDLVETNIESAVRTVDYSLQVPSYMPKDYALRDVKTKDHDVLEIVYTETGRDGEYGPKLTFSNTDIVYRMGWAIDTVVTPILEKTNYNAKDTVSFTTPNGISVHTLGYSKDAIQIAYWEKDNKVHMLYFASSRNQNFVSKIVDSVGPLSNVAADDARLRGNRNDNPYVDPDWPPYETIGLPLRTHTNSVWPILTSKTIGLPSGVIDASHKVSYDVSVPSYLPFGYTYYATHFYDNDVLETVYWKQGEEYQERSGRWVTHTMVFRMSYSMDTVWPEEYIPMEYHDVQWSDSTPIGEVQYTGDVDKGLVRSVTWYKDNMAYFLFFQVPVKASEADFYRNHVVPLKDIDPSRTDLIGVKTIR